MYYDFLTRQGAKEKVREIIGNSIKEWKQHRAYEWEPSVNDFGDTSGELHMVFANGRPQTIGDVCKTDMEVLTAYSGNKEPTYSSGCGWHYLTVADEISGHIDSCLCALRSEWILQHHEELMEAQVQSYRAEDWEDWEICDYVDENVLDGDYWNYEWMKQEFSEYIYKDDDTPMEPDLLFIIHN